MTALGAAALGGAAFVLLRCYLSYLRARRDECFALLSLLRELERGMSLHLDSPKLVFERFSAEALSPSGLVDMLKKGVVPSEALTRAESSLSVPKEAKRILRDYFFRVGESYLEGELRAVSRAISELEPIAEKERTELEKRGRVAGVLIFSTLAGVLILFL